VLYSSNFADNVGTAMHPEVFWIDRIGEGLLGIMPRPRGDDWLSDEIEALAKAGINVLVSLLTDDESAELALQDEEPHCGECGIRFISFNVRRRGEPPDWRQSEPDLGPDSGTLVNPRA